MGVPFLYRLLQAKYPEIKLSQLPALIASLSIDGNGTLHRVAAEVYGYGDYHDEKRQQALKDRRLRAEADVLFDKMLIERLTDLLEVTQPTNTFNLKFDGRAPLAKIMQQRWRRYRGAAHPASISFDSNAISPGTAFMRRVDKVVRTWLNNHSPPLPPKVIYGSHLGEGEGEHRIFDDYRSGAIWARPEEKEWKGAHLIYGLDADLIVLSLLSPLPGIVLVRENLEDIVDIDELRRQLHFDLSSGNPDAHPTAIRDLALMLELIGNDFLPASPALEDMERALAALIDAYTKLGKPLTTEAGIEWANFSSLINILADAEPELLEQRRRAEAQLMTGRGKHHREFAPLEAFGDVEKKLDMEDFTNRWYSQIFDPRDWGDYEAQLRALVPDFDEAAVDDDLATLITAYQDLLEWNLRYYTHGYRRVATDVYYPFHWAPLLGQLAEYRPAELAPIRETDTKVVYNILHQLVAILPATSDHLLPPRVRELYRPGSLIEDLMPTSVIIDAHGKVADHMALVLMPFADMPRIIDAVGRLLLWENDRSLFQPMDELVQTLTPRDMEVYAHRQREYARVHQELLYKAQRRLAEQASRGRGRGRGRGGRGRGGRGAPRGRGGRGRGT